ncbi:MAG: hypothetical protein M3373_12870 [Gemmatimonadota bacterium]|nr:hypothetical protein [Gemmatimonadota bacterium]
MQRLRGHFSAVLRELREADIAHLSPAQLKARNTLIARLGGYAAAGRFPHSHLVPGRRVPVFRDEHGTLCAMGFLIASTGRTDIVRDVAEHKNLAYLPELAGDARLLNWLDSTGLTMREAARIQPMYDPCRVPGSCRPQQAITRYPWEYAASSLTMSVLNGTLAVVNVAALGRSPRAVRRHAVLGVLVGAGQVALATHGLSQGGSHKPLGTMNAALGTAAIGTAVWRLRHLPKAAAPERTIAVSPVIPEDGKSVGLLLSARF